MSYPAVPRNITHYVIYGESPQTGWFKHKVKNKDRARAIQVVRWKYPHPVKITSAVGYRAPQD